MTEETPTTTCDLEHRDSLETNILVVSEPDSTSSTNYAVPKQTTMGPSTSVGILCDCDGYVTQLPSGFTLFEVRALAKPAGVQFLPDECRRNGYCLYIGTSSSGRGTQIPWSLPSQVEVSLMNSGNNTLQVVALIGDAMSIPLETPPSTQFDFTITSADTCTRVTRATSVKAESSAGFLTCASNDVIDVSPVGRKGNWYCYRGLSVSQFGFGNRLMFKGRPLKANCIEVAAGNVFWTRGRTHTRVITSPAGEFVTAPSQGAFFWLPGAPVSCIVIAQQSFPNPLRSVLTSQSRNRPDVIVLDPNLDVTVQVNYDALDRMSRRGSFDLWVKIVDESTFYDCPCVQPYSVE